MNGHSATTATANTNGAVRPDSSETDSQNSQILRALELVYDAHTSNEHRQDASQYLEQIKAQDEAPYHGYVLASNKSLAPAVRHYGLSLLEHAIKHRWTQYTAQQSGTLRDWVLKLALSVAGDDPLFIRNKIAQLWVEIAKRSWVLDWMDMDELLVKIWSGSTVQKELVLEILETLSENSFGKEDTATALRGHELSKACVEIFTPAQIMKEHFPRRDTNTNVRYSSEGWLSRISELLAWCNSNSHQDREHQSCAVKSLYTLKSVVLWALPHALITTHCIQRICESLTVPSHAMQLAAVECLYTLYFRGNFSSIEAHDLVAPMLESGTIDTMRRLYEWSTVDAENIDDDKYLLCKKLSEMIHNVGRYLEDKRNMLLERADLPNFLDLLLRLAQNESLHVSIPILHLWDQLLNSKTIGDSVAVASLMGPLLQICSERFLRYESLPEDSTVPAVVFLREDIDTMPERHAFLGNYARYCKNVVDSIVQKQPFDALSHILGQADQVVQELYNNQPDIDVHTYSKTSVLALKIDARFSVIEAALIGYGRWRATQKVKRKANGAGQEAPSEQLRTDESLEGEFEMINSNLEKWCLQLQQLRFKDPTIQQRVVNLVAEFAAGPLKRTPSFVTRVFFYTLSIKKDLVNAGERSDALVFNDAMGELQRACSHQLQRLAMRSADQLITIYKEIEEVMDKYCQSPGLNVQERDRCLSVLFVIVQRATALDESSRQARLENFIQPLVNKWRDPYMTTSLSSFGGFCDLLGLSDLQNYLITRKVHLIDDWGAYPLDDEGKQLKARIDAALDSLPFRSTKTFLGMTMERTDLGTPAHAVACTLWSKYVTVILPNLLNFIRLAHSFSAPSSWMGLPPELRAIPGRVLKDRFWQVGISTGSRDDFYARVEGSKSTLEGLASAIRGSLRLVRETSYRIILNMSLLGDTLYTYEELPQPLSEALFDSAGALSIHQIGVNLETARQIIEHCPPKARSHFLRPVLIAMFGQLDSKVSSEWDKIEHRKSQASADDDLLEEMKDESILRQLTFNSVSLVVHLLDPNPSHTVMSVPILLADSPPPAPTLRIFVLGTPEVLKSVILFCTHALRMHDTRACGLITRVLRSIIPVFTVDSPIAADVREFISTEVLKACITSIHDPYFVDIQSDLAQLIAIILTSYSSQTGTPQEILLSLPGMDDEIVTGVLTRLLKASTNSRQQRAVVLELLEGLRGISISEMGRLPRPSSKKIRSALEQRYMTADAKEPIAEDPSPDLGGVADMFQ